MSYNKCFIKMHFQVAEAPVDTRIVAIEGAGAGKGVKELLADDIKCFPVASDSLSEPFLARMSMPT